MRVPSSPARAAIPKEPGEGTEQPGTGGDTEEPGEGTEQPGTGGDTEEPGETPEQPGTGSDDEGEDPAPTVTIEQGKTYQTNPIASEETVAFETFTGNASDGTYNVTCAEDNKSATITYDTTVQNTWKNAAVDCAPADGMNVFSVKITNNGAVTANVRINMMTYYPAQATLNVGGTQDGVGVNTDMIYGGSFFTVDAGESIVAVVYYSGSPTQIQFMIDSHVNGLEAVSGNITISEYRFGTATPVEVTEPVA